jgi:hexosaminidase
MEGSALSDTTLRGSAPEAPALLPRPRTITCSGRRVPDRAATESIGRGSIGRGSIGRGSIGGSLPAQGYRLVTGPEEVRLEASDTHGLGYGRATLAQLRHRSNVPGGHADGTIAECEITDWPDFPVRGVMIDISRDKVPTMATIEAMIERLAGWKINHVELYMEHTFSYVGHEEVWREADPFTQADLAHLDRRCRALGVDLVPNQNTLGHFDRWLRHERYRNLAITPDGFEWIFGIRRSPTTLDPSRPEAFALVSDLLGQLVSALDKPTIHIGLDEPWELAPQRAPEWARWLEQLAGLEALERRELLVWGDILAAHPELMGMLSRIPAELTICEWGYEGNHPFGDRLSKLSEAGLRTWVCPGTSSWMSISGRAVDMLENIRNAARAGMEHGSGGLLVTDWGDFGHHQYLPVSEPGLAVAAAMSWCVSAHQDLGLGELAELLDAHCFDDPAGELGEALVALGSVHHLVTPQPPNMSPLVCHLLFPQLPVGRMATKGLVPTELDSVDSALDSARAGLARSRPERADGDLVIEELNAASRWLGLASNDARARLAGDGMLSSVPGPEREALAAECREITDEHQRLWLERNRRGGLKESSAWLRHLEACYQSGEAPASWFGPLG